MELDEGAVLLPGLAALLRDEDAALEDRLEVLALAEGGHAEVGGEGVDRLGAHAVEADGKLEYVVVVLGARIDDGHALDDLAEGDAAAVVADRDRGAALGQVLHLRHDALPRPHDELVHGVVHDLLEEDVDAVIGIRAVAKAADVHARPEADVLEGGKGLYLGFVVA